MKKSKIICFDVLLPITVAVSITIAGVYYHQSFFRMLPLYVSLVVGVLTSHVNRYASLIGGCNAVLYALVYFYYRLYGSAAYAILISCPLQIMTFIRWSKNAYRHSTRLIRMTWKQRAVLTGGLALAWIVLYAVLTSLGSSYRLLDNTLTLIGVLATVLMLLAYVEYTYLTLASGLVSLMLYFMMCRETPEQHTFLIYSIYSLICCIRSIIHVQALYTEQHSIPNKLTLSGILDSHNRKS